MVGLLPVPYASMVGLAMAAAFGMLVWPVIALVSLSRADFTAAMDSFLRVIPPPMGDGIADLFLEGNRTVARLDEKRQRLGADIAEALHGLSETLQETTAQVKNGFQTLAEQTKQASVPPRVGGQGFSRRQRKHKKWRKTLRRK
jgi:hypothetical protein